MSEEVYIVYRNADFTEGRGPMLLHKIFSNFRAAEDYVMDQEGIMGTEQKRDGYGGYNGFSIKPQRVIETYDKKDRAEKQRELEKVEAEAARLRKELEL